MLKIKKLLAGIVTSIMAFSVIGFTASAEEFVATDITSVEVTFNVTGFTGEKTTVAWYVQDGDWAQLGGETGYLSPTEITKDGDYTIKAEFEAINHIINFYVKDINGSAPVGGTNSTITVTNIKINDVDLGKPIGGGAKEPVIVADSESKCMDVAIAHPWLKDIKIGDVIAESENGKLVYEDGGSFFYTTPSEDLSSDESIVESSDTESSEESSDVSSSVAESEKDDSTDKEPMNMGLVMGLVAAGVVVVGGVVFFIIKAKK